MENLKPLFRNKNLISLSHDHHDGLVFASWIKQGILSKTDLQIIKERIKMFWESELEKHFEAEERFLFSELKREDIKRQQAEEEHLYIRSLIVRILIEEKQSAKLFQALSFALTNHIRFEERELFPHIENLLDDNVLLKIGNALKKSHEHILPIAKMDFENLECYGNICSY